MFYSINRQISPYRFDKIKTGNYGEDMTQRRLICTACDGSIKSGDAYYEVCGRIICLGCENFAEEMILDNVRGDYLYEM